MRCVWHSLRRVIDKRSCVRYCSRFVVEQKGVLDGSGSSHKRLRSARSQFSSARHSRSSAPRNRSNRTRVRSMIKSLRGAIHSGDAAAARKLLSPTIAAIDRAVTKGVLEKNTANRYKSRLSLACNAIGTAPKPSLHCCTSGRTHRSFAIIPAWSTSFGRARDPGSSRSLGRARCDPRPPWLRLSAPPEIPSPRDRSRSRTSAGYRLRKAPAGPPPVAAAGILRACCSAIFAVAARIPRRPAA